MNCLMVRSCGRGDNRVVRLLVVEDEAKMANLLARGLREEGHVVDLAARGEEALCMARAFPYDAIVVDVMLPEGDGFSICRELREQKVWTPVLLLTAWDAIDDSVGLDAGADDYLVKPFLFSELLACLRCFAPASTGCGHFRGGT